MRVVLGLALAGIVMVVGIWTLFVVLTYILMPFAGALLGMVSG